MFFEGYMGDSPKDKKIEEMKPNQGVLETELPDTDDVETYTVQQVMDILGVSRGTIYTLANRGFIEAKEYLFHSRPRKLFTQSSVDAYKKKLDSTITVTKAAEQHGLTVPHVFQLLNKHNIPYEINEKDFTRPQAVLSVESNQSLLQVVSDLQNSRNLNRRSTFLYKGYGLHQPFVDQEGNVVRLTIRKTEQRKMWGFFVKGNFIGLDTALKEGFTPLYNLNIQQRATKQHSYAIFECRGYLPETMEWIDYLYTHMGVKDLFIKQLDNNILQISVKAGDYPFEENQFEHLTLQWLMDNMIEGEVHQAISDKSITLYGKYRTQSFLLKLTTHQKVEELAATMECTQSEIVERAIQMYANHFASQKN